MSEYAVTAEYLRKRLWEQVRPSPGPHRQTQTQLAARIGVSVPFLNDILHGKREPSGKVLEWLGFERHVEYRLKRVTFKAGARK